MGSNIFATWTLHNSFFYSLVIINFMRLCQVSEALKSLSRASEILSNSSESLSNCFESLSDTSESLSEAAKSHLRP